LGIDQKALVVGGGISGMIAARTLSKQGYQVALVEKNGALGGQALNLFKTWKGENVQKSLSALVREVEKDDNIAVHLNSSLGNVEGFVGNFETTLKSSGAEVALNHGIAVIATGAQEYKPEEYLYGKDPRVMTHLELDQKFMDDPSSLEAVKTAVFIQCVGSREPERPYCSRVCCTHSMQSAIHLKEMNPESEVYILYRDIRTYGERETLYRKAREAGVLFVRYSVDAKPRVEASNEGLKIQIVDPILERPLIIRADLLTLASAIVPYRDEKLAQQFKITLNADGFFVEAHPKLAPSEFSTDGVFLCGMAHYPKPIDESVAQAQAAASRAVTLLARETIQVSGTVAYANPAYCSSCGVCVAICPYAAPSVIEEGPFAGKAEVNPALCKGCGLCVASCRSGALNLRGFENAQIMAMINEM
ncbi:MAG: NAD(P)-binding protein, partial [Deltaproteobacteria bacterium]